MVVSHTPSKIEQMTTSMIIYYPIEYTQNQDFKITLKYYTL